MGSQPNKSDELKAEEVDRQSGEELPEREAMSLIAAPADAAAALNVLTEDSTAVSEADQD